MYVVGYLHKKGLKVEINGYSDMKKRETISYETRYPGDPVPEAEGWKDHVLKANLTLGWLQTEAVYASEKAKYESEKKLFDDRREKRKAEKQGSVKKTEPQDEAPQQSLQSKSKAELMELCRVNSLPVYGKKSDLIKRLNEHQEALAS